MSARVIIREKPERGHAAVFRKTLFLAGTVASTRSILEPAELHGQTLFDAMVKRPVGACPC